MEIDSGYLKKKINYWKEEIVKKAGKKFKKQVNLEAGKHSQGHTTRTVWLGH